MDIIEHLRGPHEWGYRDPVVGGFISDDKPFRAADEIERLTEMRDYWHRMFWKERERALKAEHALYAAKGGEEGGEAPTDQPVSYKDVYGILRE